MAFTEDEEILQDFLVEAGEILEKLNKQLVDLENNPDDNELLNAVFRGFHTIKGGASFLSLTGIVEVCHRAEDVFNLLRNGERQVNARLMDVILPVLDVLNNQFDALNSGNVPQSAGSELLSSLDNVINSNDAINIEINDDLHNDNECEKVLVSQKKELSNSQNNSKSGDITDDEFEELLNSLEKKKSTKTSEQIKLTESAVSSDISNIKQKDSEYITDQEFEALLDTLHGPSVVVKVNSKYSENAVKTNVVGNKASNEEVQEICVSTKVEREVIKEEKNNVTPEKAVKRESQTQGETTVRVDTSRLDDIMNLVGELVLVRNRMSTLEATFNDDELEKVVANFDLVTTDLQAAVMKTRMQPIKKVFGRFPRVIRDLARSLNKKVNLEMKGEDTDLDKNLVDALADPLVHLVRNSVDHGIELPEVREKLGKPEHGTVILGAKQEGDHISLTIEDDGAGIDPEKLKGIAIGKGLMDEETAARLTEREAYNLIFMAGFSTKEVISDVSGRGVGMDVVKNSIAQLNGMIEIESQVGKGSKITIKVPLTLAIMPTLMIKLDTQVFALPLVNVGEILNLDLTKTNVVDGQLVIMIRDTVLPIYYLKRWLVKGAMADQLPQLGHVVVVAVGTQRVGFVVDQLVGQEEVVIKPLGSTLQGTPGLSGATITGDGKIALILDVPQLMTTYARMA